MLTRSLEPVITDGQLSNFLERPHTFSSFVRLNDRLTTIEPARGSLPERSNEPSFTMSKQHVAVLRNRRTRQNPCVRTSGDPVLNASGTGGARRDRTDDLMLAKHALSQLSYGPLFGNIATRRKWWARKDLNLRPHAYQARALTS